MWDGGRPLVRLVCEENRRFLIHCDLLARRYCNQADMPQINAVPSYSDAEPLQSLCLVR